MNMQVEKMEDWGLLNRDVGFSKGMYRKKGSLTKSEMMWKKPFAKLMSASSSPMVK